MSLTRPQDDLTKPQDEAAAAGARGARVTAPALLEQKRRGIPIVAMTAYDYPTAKLCEDAGVDLVLVGDSLAMAVLGHEDTLSVTMPEMLHHVKAVRRGLNRAMLVADMPYGSYHVSVSRTLRNALKFMQAGGAQAVKLEGGQARAGLVRSLTAAEIPVVGHIGLTPQSVHSMGGYKVQGKTLDAVEHLCRDALALEDAGAIAVVLEGIPREVAARITGLLQVPTIGIGAGPDCDGQILVFHDAFGLTFRHQAKFVRRFGEAGNLIAQGLSTYADAVRARTFPDDAESYHLARELREELEQETSQLPAHELAH